MARKLGKCKSGKDFLNFAEKKGAIVKPGKGSHHKVITPKGTCIVPVHGNKQLPKGTHRSIFNTFVKIGLFCLLLLLSLPFLCGGAL